MPIWMAQLPVEVAEQLSPEEIDMLTNDLDEAVQAVCQDYGVEI